MLRLNNKLISEIWWEKDFYILDLDVIHKQGRKAKMNPMVLNLSHYNSYLTLYTFKWIYMYI